VKGMRREIDSRGSVRRKGQGERRGRNWKGRPSGFAPPEKFPSYATRSFKQESTMDPEGVCATIVTACL